MSSSGGGIVVKVNATGPQVASVTFTKDQGQIMVNALTECGETDMAAALQAIVNAAT